MEHDFFLYEDPEEGYCAGARFLAAGVERGERCVFAAGERGVEEAAEALGANGLAVEALRRSGALTLLDGRDVYMPSGTFSGEAALHLWGEILSESLAGGWPGLTACGDLGAVTASPGRLQGVVDYEAKVNDLGDVPVRALCLYDRRRFAPGLLRRILIVHPHALVKGFRRENRYYSRMGQPRGGPGPGIQEMLVRLDGG